ncbi:hypothetical protein Hdeb2414_s0001g00019671 [Helianthus debilis subsp. tardiflorus]
MIGLSLEGFIKMQGTLELITAPAALFPSYGNRSFRVSEIVAAGSFCYHATSYVVETRSWVMMFEISGFEGTGTLQRRVSSLISHGEAGDNPSSAREHSGLMSWQQGSFKREFLSSPCRCSRN